MLVRGWRGRAALALASAALTLAASACTGSSGVDEVPRPVGSPVAMGSLLRGIASAKADMAQYQLDLHVACRLGSSRPCWEALRYSATIGANVAADLTPVNSPPAEVADLWDRTLATVLALQTVAARSCRPGPPLDSCSGAVDRAIQALNRALARWDVYVAWK